jgi:rubrerythrin
VLELAPDLAARLDSPEGLRDALQTAIRLEHSTLPPYLYALYSIEPGKNTEIAALIASVAIEEMTHMALACNMLSAVGGTPAIASPDFVPTYPGPLPGSVETSLRVSLRKLSREHVHDTFMVIEEPEEALEFPDMLEALAPSLTIGQFYRRIRAQLPDAEFSGAASLQATHPLMPELVAIRDAAGAQAAIDLIVEQGEGTRTSPLGSETEDELAHYYRFAEIYHQRKLVRHADPALPPDQQYSYSGEKLVIDPAGVRDLIDDPKRSDFAPGSHALHLFDTFNYTYTSVLKTLQLAFTGHPEALDAAIGLMESCKHQALGLGEVTLADGRRAGPGFQWQPTNP